MPALCSAYKEALLAGCYECVPNISLRGRRVLCRRNEMCRGHTRSRMSLACLGLPVRCRRPLRRELPCPGEPRAGWGQAEDVLGVAHAFWNDCSADARSGSGRDGGRGPAGREEEKRSCFQCLAGAQAVSPREVEAVWESAPETQAGGDLPAAARGLEVPGLTVHDKSVFFSCEMWSGREGGCRPRSGLSPGVSGKGKEVLAEVAPCIAIPEASWEFLGDGAHPGVGGKLRAAHAEEGTGRGSGGGSGRPSS